jgi:capsid protein
VKHARKAFALLQAANAAREACQIIAAAFAGIIVRGVVQLYDSTRAQKRLQARLMVLLPFHELSSGNRKPS